MTENIIPAGTLLIFNHGEYSDFSYTGPFRVNREIDKQREAQAYRDQWKPADPTDTYDYHPDEHGFIVWLHHEGFITDEPSDSWHIGSYGRFEP